MGVLALAVLTVLVEAQQGGLNSHPLTGPELYMRVTDRHQPVRHGAVWSALNHLIDNGLVTRQKGEPPVPNTYLPTDAGLERLQIPHLAAVPDDDSAAHPEDIASEMLDLGIATLNMLDILWERSANNDKLTFQQLLGAADSSDAMDAIEELTRHNLFGWDVAAKTYVLTEAGAEQYDLHFAAATEQVEAELESQSDLVKELQATIASLQDQLTNAHDALEAVVAAAKVVLR